MPRILILSSDTIDKIAAGEVVERPRNVVKELVENSIDGNATNISVEIREGGIELIRVTDNGIGIEEDQVTDAFIRHATSKLSSIEDLDSLNSLGFRGEALSSIAGVSKTEMITKTNDCLMASHVVIEGGVLRENNKIGAPDGTTILVRQLFYNTPARRKFLKSTTTEASYIQDIMEKFALSHPQISFRYICSKQQRIITTGNGKLLDVIYRIYGKEAYESCLEAHYEDDKISIHGYVSKPEYSSSGRSQEIYFVNGRFVKSDVISNSIEEVYKNYLMQHRFPFCVLNIKVNPKNLDVNVHPQKMEVRFADNAYINEKIIECIREALSHKELIPNVKEDDHSIIDTIEHQQFIKEQPIISSNRVNDNNVTYKTKEVSEHKETYSSWIPSEDEDQQIKVSDVEENYCKTPEPFEKRRLENIVFESITNCEQTNFFDEKLMKADEREYQIIGQIFDTYWLITLNETLYIVDQHAAHEKVNYEELVNRYESCDEVTSQIICPPLMIHLVAKEEDTLLKYMFVFKKIGYEIEEFGMGSYAIRSAPVQLYGVSSDEMFNIILNELSEKDYVKTPQIVLEKLAQASCKAAVKGNNKMTYEEMKALMTQLMSLDNPYNCPHGRPVFIAMTKNELEKKFKRIV